MCRLLVVVDQEMHDTLDMAEKDFSTFISSDTSRDN